MITLKTNSIDNDNYLGDVGINSAVISHTTTEVSLETLSMKT